MSGLDGRLSTLKEKQSSASLQVRTLGSFSTVVGGQSISSKTWGRDKTLQLFQFLITARTRSSLHREKIIDRLWEDAEKDEGDRNFKVALHGINKALEPNRPPRTDPKYIIRQGITYQLNHVDIWIDAQAVEDYIAVANEARGTDNNIAISAYRSALECHSGVYLPNRIYEDWSSEERERLQVLILSAYISLAELMLDQQPLETVRLAQKAISIDSTWEDAYQLQMKAYLVQGNRPAAIKSYQQCVKVLDKEFGLDPLPETQEIYDSIM